MLKVFLKKQGVRTGNGFTWPQRGYARVAECFERGNETWGSVKRLFDKLSDSQQISCLAQLATCTRATHT
jgi:hypothetical protein